MRYVLNLTPTGKEGSASQSLRHAQFIYMGALGLEWATFAVYGRERARAPKRTRRVNNFWRIQCEGNINLHTLHQRSPMRDSP